MKAWRIAISAVAVLWLAGPAAAQIGGKLGSVLDKAQKAKDTLDQITISEAEERQLGEDVSQKLRDKYGVVQDKAIHKYVTLVGTVLARASSRPNLQWTFIVLDTDGVNAFAAPGGFVHVTRGALALIQNESELADVLGHEISHITAKHTVNAIQKNKTIQVAADASRQQVVQQFADKTYEMLLENKYDRKDEMDADEKGVVLANRVGYAPGGLGAFLTRLADRNKGLKEPSGLFASHPETQARVDGLARVIAANKLTAPATVAARYHENVSYKPIAVDAMAAAGADSKSSGGKFGLSGLSPVANDKSSTQTVSSAGSRGVNPDRDAKGGPVKTPVPVTVTAAELADFRKGIV
jgi:predicted Zn-dependent protease